MILNCSSGRDIRAQCQFQVRVKFTRAMWLRPWRRPRAEKWLAMQSLVLCLLSVIALRIIGFGRWKGILWASSGGRNLAATTFSHGDVSIAGAYASVVDMVARNTPWAWSLACPGLSPCGGCYDDMASRANCASGCEGTVSVCPHAWMVCHGTVVGETVHDRFVSFESEALAIWVLAFDIDPAPLGATVNLL